MKTLLATLLASAIAFPAIADLPRIFPASKAPTPMPKAAPAQTADDPTPPNPAPAPVPPQPTPVPPTPPPDPVPTPPDVSPYISIPNAISANPGAWITLRASTNCKHVIWDNIDTTGNLNVLDEELLADPFVTIASSIVPGQYRIKAIAAYADQPIQSNWCVITVVGPRPPPPAPDPPKPPPGPVPPPTPDPVPPPAPEPTPATGPLSIVIVENTAARTKATATLMADRAYWDGLKAAGNNIYPLDSNSTQAAKYKPQVDAAGGQPVLMIIDSKGTLLSATQFPKDATGKANPSKDWVNSLVTKYGGKTVARK